MGFTLAVALNPFPNYHIPFLLSLFRDWRFIGSEDSVCKRELLILG